MTQQQRNNPFLIFESQIDQNFAAKTNNILHSKNSRWIWSERLVFIDNGDNQKFRNFIAVDLLMNESRPICFRRIANKFNCIGIFPLNDEFGIIIEYAHNYSNSVNLIKIDWELNEFKLIEKFNVRFAYFDVIVDKMDSSKFVLRFLRGYLTLFYQDCKFVNEKIKFGKEYQSRESYAFYSKDRLIKIEGNYKYMNEIVTYNLISTKEETFKIDRSSLPENVVWTDKHEWVDDRCYSGVYFPDTKKIGLAWTDLEKKRWHLMENFETNLWIEKLEFFGNNLIVETKSKSDDNRENSNEVKYYGIPMRRPNSLRKLAWILVVQIMKNCGEKNPYEASKEYLPLTSDLRAHWFKDEEEKS